MHEYFDGALFISSVRDRFVSGFIQSFGNFFSFECVSLFSLAALTSFFAFSGLLIRLLDLMKSSLLKKQTGCSVTIRGNDEQSFAVEGGQFRQPLSQFSFFSNVFFLLEHFLIVTVEFLLY